MATLTVYPDPDVESTSVDGCTAEDYGTGAGIIWATIRGNPGNWASDTQASSHNVVLLTSDAAGYDGKWRDISRGIFLFDTSALTAAAVISAAIFSLYGTANRGDSFTQSVGIVSSNPASNTAVVAGDYDSLGTTRYATDITIANWTASAYNDFTLNTDGKNAISKTSITKFGTRLSGDLDNSEPVWSAAGNSYVDTYLADQAGTDNDPKLVITYTVPSGNFFHFF